MLKRLALTAAAVLLSLLMIELGAVAAYWIWRGHPVPRREILERLAKPLPFENNVQRREGPTAPLFVSNKSLHPYLGFVYGPAPRNRNSFGFAGPEPLFADSEDTLDIAVFGGSLALAFCGEGHPAIVEELTKAKPGRSIRMSCFAVDGYKQPQHLIALAYMLSLGMRIDVAVNLDGFNEIALPLTENLPSGVYPFYPRAWNLYAANGFQPEIAARTARIADRRAERVFWRRFFARFPLRVSNFFLVLWDSLDRLKDSRAKQLDREIQSLLADESNPALGPFDPAAEPREVLLASTRAWRTASLQMAALCRDAGIRYLHFLQPNQYVAGSKVFSQEESRVAFGEAGYRSVVEEGYPLLLREGETLRDEGVEFFDLTRLFREHPETLYRDACCHVNARGNEILGREIGRRIRQALREGDPPAGAGGAPRR